MADGGRGREVGWLFQRALALVLLGAWLSLLAQVRLLMGSRGLLPIAPLLAAARGEISFWQFPTQLWLGAGDGALVAWCWVGIVLAVVALADRLARPIFAVSALLYLGMATAGRTFFSFQWDNLLVESCVLAALLPSDRAARLPNLLLRLLVVKVYVGSGLAKLESDLGDWIDGSAMTHYYETAPLPTWGGWYAHALPVVWHHIESRFATALELLAPLALAGWGRLDRRLRLAAVLSLTVFQLINLATANYGFFVYLTLALHLFFLDDDDIARWSGWLRARLRRPRREASAPSSIGRRLAVARQAALACFAAVYVAAPLVDMYAMRSAEASWAARLAGVWAPWRLFNTYHLFGHITVERIEPEVQTFDGARWAALDLRYKPGAVDRAPGWVAPHQPRVDFQLWFYGLSYEAGTPLYVRTLLARLCQDPEALRGLFAAPPPLRPRAVRIELFRYHFTTPAERRQSGAWWRREPVTIGPTRTCD